MTRCLGSSRLVSSAVGLLVLVGAGFGCQGAHELEEPRSSQEHALGSATSCGASDTFSTTNLLQDPTMANGVQLEPNVGTIKNSSSHPNHATNCVNQYASKGITNARWTFTEVCEDTCFCDNPVNPVIANNQITYGNNFKSFSINKTTGVISMAMDTSKEWRSGCALNYPQNGVNPDYINENTPWNWNHLLISQATNLDINGYDKLEFKADFKLTGSARTMTGNCPTGDMTGDGASFNPPHALLYLAVLVQHVASPAPTGDELTSSGHPVSFFALIRLWTTQDGNIWTPGDTAPFGGGDPASNYVYVARTDDELGTYKLSKGMSGYQTYTVDLRRLAREALYGRGQTMNKWVTESHYKITSVYFGAEVWGGYALSMEAKNLSLKGHNYSSARCVNWNRYWSSSATDHTFLTDYLPGGFSGYVYEGRAAATPTFQMNGSTPLYRYWNAAAGDHFFTTGLWPFGAGCSPPCQNGGWVYEGAKAYVWTAPGAGRVPMYGFWNGSDHFFSADPQEGTRAGYSCDPSCGTPVFYMAQ
jgi:hypothetical protein